MRDPQTTIAFISEKFPLTFLRELSKKEKQIILVLTKKTSLKEHLRLTLNNEFLPTLSFPLSRYSPLFLRFSLRLENIIQLQRYILLLSDNCVFETDYLYITASCFRFLSHRASALAFIHSCTSGRFQVVKLLSWRR